jgi:DNA-binding MarR family transcriptional regulator
MRIEEEIKQIKFKDEFQKLMINQLFTGKWITNIISKSLRQFGLTSQQYNVLRILRGQKDSAISVNAISERMIDKMSNVSRLVDKLKAKGLVRRKVNLEDRRQVDIEITEKGIALIVEVEKSEPEMMNRFSQLSEEDAKKLNELLDKFRG